MVQNCKRSWAHKRYSLSIYWLWKMTKFTIWKKWQKWSNNDIQTTCTFSYHEENTGNVSKQSIQNWNRSCAPKTPRVNVDGWTDGRTMGRKLVSLSRPAKADATKIVQISRSEASDLDLNCLLSLLCYRHLSVCFQTLSESRCFAWRFT